MTSAPPFAGAASVIISVSAGGAAAGFFRGARFFLGSTSSSLSVTYQPRFKCVDFYTSRRLGRPASLPSSARLRKPDDLFGDFFRRLCLSQHRGIRSGVERIARREELAHTGYRVITHQNGPGSRFRRATCCLFGARLQVDEIPA